MYEDFAKLLRDVADGGIAEVYGEGGRMTMRLVRFADGTASLVFEGDEEDTLGGVFQAFALEPLPPPPPSA